MVRTLFALLLIVLFVLMVVVFTWRNPDTIEIDLAFGQYQDVPKALAFAVALGVGWLWGALTASVYVLKLLNERRRLRKKVRLADAELSNLRSLPMQDAG